MKRIDGDTSIDIGAGRTGFRSRNALAGVSGTVVKGDWLNGVQEEIMTVIEHAGLSPDGSDWSQLWQAIQIITLQSGLVPIAGIAQDAPAAAATGDIWLVATAPVGAFAGQANKLAIRLRQRWVWLDAKPYTIAVDPSGTYWQRVTEGWQPWSAGDVAGPVSLASLADHIAGALPTKATHPAGVAAAIQAGAWISADDTSAIANKIVINPGPPLSACAKYQTFRIKLANTITGPATVKIGTLPEVPLVRCDGAKSQSGDGYAGGIIQVTHDGTNFQLAALPPVLSGINTALTFYVRTDGNDSNTGLANTAQEAFKTLQGAVNAVSSRYITKGGVTINVGAGTYAGFEIGPSYVSSWTIIGNVSVPASVVINGGAGRSVLIGTGAIAEISGFKYLSQFENLATAKGNLKITGANILSPPTSGQVACIACYGGSIGLYGSITLSGTAYGFLAATDGGAVNFGYNDSVYTNPLDIAYSATFSSANVITTGCASVNFFPPAVKMTGSVTGQRYAAGNNGVINTKGSGENYIPGTVAGWKGNGGQYS